MFRVTEASVAGAGKRGGGRCQTSSPEEKQHGRRQVLAVVLLVESSPGQPQGLS